VGDMPVNYETKALKLPLRPAELFAASSGAGVILDSGHGTFIRSTSNASVPVFIAKPFGTAK
jgi:hypothetical protein